MMRPGDRKVISDLIEGINRLRPEAGEQKRAREKLYRLRRALAVELSRQDTNRFERS